MAYFNTLTLVSLVLLSVSHTHAGCPHAARMLRTAGNHVAMPKGQPNVPAPTTRKLQAASTVSAGYLAAFRRMTVELESVIGDCQFSVEGMAYATNTKIIVNSSSVFMPAASWLRSFFHDAGTFIKSPSKGGPKGGPNGSLGVGCPRNPCGTQTANSTINGVNVTIDTTCPNGAPSVTGFTDGKAYCCPNADECIAHGQSANAGPTPGRTVPVCLKGSAATVELCRRENDNLHPTIQFLRGRQQRADLTFPDPAGGPNKTLSFADILVASGVAAVKQCSKGRVIIPYTVGRPEATVADDTLLPSPQGLIEQKHFEIFQNMGLNKNDMITLVTGSHSIGGFHTFSSPGLTDCPYVPFDCSPAGQTSDVPFDNNVFKVACDGIRGISKGACDWNDKCTDPTNNETAQGCPFEGNAREAYQHCSAMPGYPQPGLVSDKFFCEDPPTQGRMVKYAEDQDFFYAQYASLYSNLANLGYKNSDITTLSSNSRRRRAAAGN
uniref:Plant heme peroxidase family profile domain-containing protein n=1 Tax=Tetradesmus obliquus TaxID=3088 RepID=A0A383VUW9_TETOB|eukprot:jgi/Sobl393_1/17800/SZX68663.1